MKYLFSAAALAASVCAFPSVTAPDDSTLLEDRSGLRYDEENSGFFRNRNHGQLIDIRPGSGHEFTAPSNTDIRGPCPGLNAAANHKFISHTGVLDMHDTIVNLPNAIGIGHDFTTILFYFAVFNSGSFIDMKWSIGGPMKSATLGVLGGGRGISNSHNKYEGDSSPGRGDAYLHNGDAHSLNIPNFSNFYHDAAPDGTYNLRVLRRQANRAHQYTKDNNPYAFFGPVFFVSPIAHQFVVTMMSNFSPEHPQGQLTKETLKTFFSVKEAKDGTLTWVPGHDAIPHNWYRRPANNLYGTAASFGDFAITCAQTPEICEVGGNLGKPGDYVGVDLGDFTGGVFNAKDLTKGDNAACFAMEALVFAVPGLANKLLEGASKFSRLAQKFLGKEKAKLGCPQIEFDESQLKKYPGFTWEQPIQPATPY